jgi:hypothetical protein
MALSNAEKQRRWRARNQIVLTATAKAIAGQLVAMADQEKVRAVADLLNAGRRARSQAAAAGPAEPHEIRKLEAELGRTRELLAKAEAKFATVPAGERDREITRAPASEDYVEEFMEIMRQGIVELPPVRAVLRQVGDNFAFSVSDGAHRTAAALRIGYSHIPVVWQW